MKSVKKDAKSAEKDAKKGQNMPIMGGHTLTIGAILAAVAVMGVVENSFFISIY